MSSAATILLLVFILLSGIGGVLESLLVTLTPHLYVALLLFAAAISIAQGGITLPLGFYANYSTEHRYGLSNQSLLHWVLEHFKRFLVGLPIVLGVLFFFYFCLRQYGPHWWFPVGCVLTLLSVVLARLAPTIIMPFFYRFTPLEDTELKERLLRLCNGAGFRIQGVFLFDLSKNTRKINAGFTGIGKSKRIILGDTLVKEFSHEEIETVFAHEMGHYRHRHILADMVIGILVTFLGLYAAARLYEWTLPLFGLASVVQLAALPLLALWLTLYGLVTAPIINIISRRQERQADSYAIQQTGNRPAFISALRKLASRNLADPEPHPLVEFLFYSHPSIGRRIRILEST